MARSLVIVESPAKAKTINRYLGKDFVVKSSVGHIRDLPTGGKAVDPKARAKEAKKTKALTPAKREALKRSALEINWSNAWESTLTKIGLPSTKFYPARKKWSMN